MEIWSFINSKGGSGKTTLATNVAACLSVKYAKRVCLVDSDPQGSVRDWQEECGYKTFPVIGLDRKQSLKMIHSVINENDFDYVLIDTPGRSTDLIAASIALSDKVIIPIQPSPYDIWSVGDIVEILEARKEVANKPISFFAVNRAIKNTKLEKEVNEALQQYNLPVLKTHVTHRVVYAQAAAKGITVFETSHSEAINEINELTREIIHGPIKSENEKK
jgi:chromosome partitioning protein